MEEKIIRGRKVIYEGEPPREPAEYLRYTLDVYDERDDLIEALGRVADLAVAHAAFDAAAKLPARCRLAPPNSRAGAPRRTSSWPSPATSHCPRFNVTPTSSIVAKRPMPPWHGCSKPEQNCKTQRPGFTISAISS